MVTLLMSLGVKGVLEIVQNSGIFEKLQLLKFKLLS